MPKSASMMPVKAAPVPTNVKPVSLHPNPISDPQHPAHIAMTQNIGRALGHLMTGDVESARGHLHDALDNWLEPHAGSPASMDANDGGSMMPSSPAQQTTTDSAPKRKRKKKA
jgi:hypothetical protein